MRSRFSLTHLIAMTVLFGVASAAVAQDFGTASGQKKDDKEAAGAKIGEAAPDFELKDADGKKYKLSDYKGKIVVLQWINPGCPVCRRVVKDGVVRNMLKEIKALDENVVHLAINSTARQNPEDNPKYLAEHKIKSPALIDQDGTVGKLYDAKTTPHMYVIDAKGILRYHGAIDDDGRGSKGESATNYVVNAVQQITRGETVAPDMTRPYGCTVKYARGGKRN